MAVTEALTRPVGPLPAWQWGLVIGGGYIAYRLLTGGSAGSSSGTSGGTSVSGSGTGGSIVQGPQGEIGPPGVTVGGSGVTPSDVTDWLNAGVPTSGIKTIIDDLTPPSTVQQFLTDPNGVLTNIPLGTPGHWVPVGTTVNGISHWGFIPTLSNGGTPGPIVNPPSTTPGNTTPGNIPDTTIHLPGVPTTTKPAGATGYVDTSGLARIWSSVSGVNAIVPSAARSFTFNSWVGPIVNRSYIPVNTGGPSSTVRRTGQFRQILSGPQKGSWILVGSSGAAFH